MLECALYDGCSKSRRKDVLDEMMKDDVYSLQTSLLQRGLIILKSDF